MLNDINFSYIQEEHNPETGDCLNVALALNFIDCNSTICALVDDENIPSHFFVKIENRYYDGTGEISIEDIKDKHYGEKVKEYDLRNDDLIYQNDVLYNQDTVDDIVKNI